MKTDIGLSDPLTVPPSILQGDTLSSIMATSQMSNLANNWHENYKEKSFSYRGKIPLGIIGHVDDNIGLAEAGPNTAFLNMFLNVKAGQKGIYYNSDKMKKMNVTSKGVYTIEDTLKIDSWSSKKENNAIIDNYEGVSDVKDVVFTKYLGIFIDKFGNNQETIKDKTKKASANITTIKAKLDHLKLVLFIQKLL